MQPSREQCLLELICAQISGEVPPDEPVDIDLWKYEIERAGFRFDEAMVVVRDFERRKMLHNVGASLHLDTSEISSGEVDEIWRLSFLTWPGIRSYLDDLWNGEKRRTPAKYDAEKGVLHFMDNNIVISERSSKTRSQYIMEYLFSQPNPAEQHFYSEIGERLFSDEEHNARTYYRACEAINAKVLKATAIKDFLIFSSGEKGFVRVNPLFVP